MGKVIQMVVISPDNTLFITDFNEETEEMVFRTSRVPKYRQIEKITISEDMVYTNLYNFSVVFLSKFITSNMD